MTKQKKKVCGAEVPYKEEGCQLPAGHGTVHPGKGKCLHHGGTRTEKNGPACGAKLRSREEGTCQNGAGHGTDHPGQGRCKYHGGCVPIKHGRYSKIQHPRLKKLIDSFENDPEMLDLKPEAILLRALLSDFINRNNELQEQLSAWHGSYAKRFQKEYREWYAAVMEKAEDGEPPEELPEPPEPRDFDERPGSVGALDINAAGKLIDQVGNMVDRIEKHKQTSSISLGTLSHVLEQVGVELVHTLQEEVKDASQRARILQTFERRWSSVRITPDGSVAPGRSSSVPN